MPTEKVVVLPPSQIKRNEYYVIQDIHTDDSYHHIEKLYGQVVQVISETNEKDDNYVSCDVLVLEPFRTRSSSGRVQTFDYVNFYKVQFGPVSKDIKFPKRTEKISDQVRKKVRPSKKIPFKTISLMVENGGGSKEHIWDLMDTCFEGIKHPSRAFPQCPPTASEEEQIEARHRFADRLELRTALYSKLQELNTDTFYTSKGAKITKPLKVMIENVIGKEATAKGFTEFCKGIRELYSSVQVEATLRPVYFEDETTGIGLYGDHDSCFRPHSANSHNGEFIDRSLSTAVITITPESSKFARSRMIVWVTGAQEAYLYNRYNTPGRREIPVSIFVRALEKLTGTKITFCNVYPDINFPIYTNHRPVRCTVTNKKSFLDTGFILSWWCKECGKYFSPADAQISTERQMATCSERCYRNAGCEDEEGHHCDCCGAGGLGEDDCYFNDGETYCEDCYNNHFSSCDFCGCTYGNDEMGEMLDSRGRARTACAGCVERHGSSCVVCSNMVHEDYTQPCHTSDSDVERVCKNCLDDVAECPNEDCGVPYLDSLKKCPVCGSKPEARRERSA